MKLQFNQLVWAPTVALVGKTVMNYDGLEEAVEQMGAVDAAEKDGTPLNNLMARVALDGGNGDDLAEFAGRQCYRSWTAGRDSAEYHRNIRSQGHGSIYEHGFLSFQVTGVSRTLTHELVRHGEGTGISQESQRYVDAKDMRFVIPPLLANAIIAEVGYTPTCISDIIDIDNAGVRDAFNLFYASCSKSLEDYIALQPLLVAMAKEAEAASIIGDDKAVVSAKKRANEAARSVLHNACETRLVWSMNLRASRHIMLMRGDEPADLEIRRLSAEFFPHVVGYAPHLFADLSIETGSDNLPIITTSEAKRL